MYLHHANIEYNLHDIKLSVASIVLGFCNKFKNPKTLFCVLHDKSKQVGLTVQKTIHVMSLSRAEYLLLHATKLYCLKQLLTLQPLCFLLEST